MACDAPRQGPLGEICENSQFEPVTALTFSLLWHCESYIGWINAVAAMCATLRLLTIFSVENQAGLND